MFPEKPEVRFDLVFGYEMRLGVTPCVFGETPPLGRFANQAIEGGNETSLILIGDQTPRTTRLKAFPDAHDVVSDCWQAMKLGFDQEIRKRFTLRRQYCDVGSKVKRRGIGLVSEKFHA